MSPTDGRRSEARKWLREASKDLHAAKLMLLPEEAEPSISLFHSQQAAEKAAKAFLAFHDVAFRRTHDLVELGLECGDLDPELTPLLNEAADLTDYATVFRYPDAPYEPDVEEALRAREIAGRVYEQVRVRVEGLQEQMRTGDSVAQGQAEPNGRLKSAPPSQAESTVRDSLKSVSPNQLESTAPGGLKAAPPVQGESTVPPSYGDWPVNPDPNAETPGTAGSTALGRLKSPSHGDWPFGPAPNVETPGTAEPIVPSVTQSSKEQDQKVNGDN